MDDDLTACAEIVQRADPERFLAAMAAPVEARRILFPIYAFNAEVARAPWVTQEPMIAEMRLQWWRDVLAEIREGGPVRRHEVATPLAAVLDAEGAALLEAVVEARRWDIYKEPFEDEAAFEAHLTRTAGHLMWACARALGAKEEAAVLDAGYAHGLGNWLRAIPALEAARRVPLLDGRPDAVRTLAQSGLLRLRRGRKARQDLPLAAMLPLWKTRAILQGAVRYPHDVSDGTLDVSPLRSRATLLWSATTGRW